MLIFWFSWFFFWFSFDFLLDRNLVRPYGFNVPYRQLFAAFEGILSKYQGRPHWAKAHHLRPHQLRQLYPRFDDFIRVIEQADPTGIFRNAYINRHLFGVTDASTDERIHKAYQRTIGWLATFQYPTREQTSVSSIATFISHVPTLLIANWHVFIFSKIDIGTIDRVALLSIRVQFSRIPT